jgi:hypothetical protein
VVFAVEMLEPSAAEPAEPGEETLPGQEAEAAAAQTPAQGMWLSPQHTALLMTQMFSAATAEWEWEAEGGASLVYVDTAAFDDAQQGLSAMQAQWAQSAQSQGQQLSGATA